MGDELTEADAVDSQPALGDRLRGRLPGHDDHGRAGPLKQSRDQPTHAAGAEHRDAHDNGSISTPGFIIPRGSTAAFAPRSACGEGLGALPVIPGPVIAPDSVMVSDRATLGDHYIGDGPLDLSPLLYLFPAPRGREHREVGSGAVRIDVGEAAEDPALAAALLAHRLLGRGDHALVEDGEALPGDSRLERLAQHAHGDEHVAQIGSAQEGVPPRAHRVPTGSSAALRHDSAVLGTDLQGSCQRLVHRVVGRLEAEHEQGVGAVRGHRQPGLAGIEQAAVGWMQPRLRDRAHALNALEEALKSHTRRAPVRRTRLHAHPCLRDHPQCALGAGEHPVRAYPRARPRQPPRHPHTHRCDRANGLDEILDVRPHGREMAGGARGDPATQSGVLE